jgi:predicted RNase H-like nuclease (RuvC/YqgF family)
MDNLLFTVLLIALLYYFFYYLPSQKKLSNPPLKIINDEPSSTVQFPSAQFVPDPEKEGVHSELSQIIKDLEKEIKAKEKNILGLNNSCRQLELKVKEKDHQVQELQSQMRELAKRPLKPTSSKGTQTDELTQVLDNLIKEVQQLNNSL